MDRGLAPVSVLATTFEERNFSLLGVVGIGYSVTNSAMAILASLGTGIGSGGPVLLIWGQIAIFLISLCIAVTLGEFASAMPNAAGQFYWVSKLAPKKTRRYLAYNVGMLSWASSLCIVASGTLLVPQMIIGMYMLHRPDFVYQRWMGFVGYQLTNFVIFFFNTVERFLPTLSRASMTWSMVSIIVIFIAILAKAPVKQSASFVFTDFVNMSGWNNVVAAFTGCIGVNWGYSCLDACAHMAEEIPQPDRNIPKALMSTIIIGFLTAFPFTIAILFCIGDLNDVITTRTMVPSLEVFYQVFSGESAGAIGLQSLVVVVFVGSIFGAHTWQSCLCWTFARQGGLPCHQALSKIADKPFSVPLWSHLLSCICVCLLGFIYLGSSVAFNSFVSGGLLFQNTTYSICVICLLLHGRSKFAHGSFWFPTLGYICDIVTVVWSIYTLVLYSFPPSLPVTLVTMNYIAVVYVGVILITNIFWAAYGRKYFTCF